jgi:hypothetical protein
MSDALPVRPRNDAYAADHFPITKSQPVASWHWYCACGSGYVNAPTQEGLLVGIEAHMDSHNPEPEEETE